MLDFVKSQEQHLEGGWEAQQLRPAKGQAGHLAAVKHVCKEVCTHHQPSPLRLPHSLLRFGYGRVHRSSFHLLSRRVLDLAGNLLRVPGGRTRQS